MPDYEFTHPATGRTVVISGDSPPDEATVDRIFSETAQIGGRHGGRDISQYSDAELEAIAASTPPQTPRPTGSRASVDPFTVPPSEVERRRREFVAREAAPGFVDNVNPAYSKVSFGGNKPQSTVGIATPRQQQEAAQIMNRLESPTAPAQSFGEFVTRVIPESAAKTVVNAYKLPTAVAGDIVAPAAGGDVGTAIDNTLELAKGVIGGVTKPIGLQGIDAAKEAWTTDPVGSALAVTAIKPLAKPTLAAFTKGANVAGDLASGFLGTTTGTSKNMVKQAFNSGPDFAKYMRAGEEGGADIVGKAKEALQQVREERGNTYRAQLDEIGKNTEPIADAPVMLKTALGQNLKKFGVDMVPDQAGTFQPDFSRSTFNRKAQGDVADIIDTVQSWGTKEGDLTPLGLDTLKRQLDDFYSDSKNSRAMVADLRNKVKGLIVDRVPEYSDMTKAYEEATKQIGEFEHTLSLGKKPAIDTTLRKLTQSMRDNFQFRKEILDSLSNMTGENLADMIAGYNMSSWYPQGGFGKLTAGGTGVATLTHAVSPAYLTMLAAASPRIVGESLRGLGLTTKGVQNVWGNMPKVRLSVSGGLPAVVGTAANAAQRSKQPTGYTYQNGQLIPNGTSDPLGIRGAVNQPDLSRYSDAELEAIARQAR